MAHLAATELCPFCRAQVPRGTLGYHYAGYRCEPCPDVAYAFGPDAPRVYESKYELAPDSYVHGFDSRHPCAVRGCTDVPYRHGRCLEHYREQVKAQRGRDRAKALAKQAQRKSAAQGRVSV